MKTINQSITSNFGELIFFFMMIHLKDAYDLKNQRVKTKDRY